MSEQQPAPGWYPQGDVQRYWDGARWTDQTAPLAPSGSVATQQTYAQPKQKHTVRNVLLILIAVAVLFMAGCTALVVVGVGGAVDDATKADKAPGGPDNPLEIAEGKAFSVNDFDYAAGWSISKDALGDVQVKGLKVTNGRGEKDSAIVEIKFWNGSEVLAVTDCSTEPIAPDTTTSLTCISGDKLPKSYDKVTINDSF